VAELEGVSIPLSARFDVHDGQPPVFDLVLLHDIRRSNRGDMMRGYSVLYDRVLYYNALDITELRQGANGAKINALEDVVERYKLCVDGQYDLLRAQLHALLYLAVQDSVIQSSEVDVVRKFLAGKNIGPLLQSEFLFYFKTSFITPDAIDEVLGKLPQLSPEEQEVLLDTGVGLIEANGAVSPWERKAFQELVEACTKAGGAMGANASHLPD
jgi:hypothetical protein